MENPITRREFVVKAGKLAWLNFVSFYGCEKKIKSSSENSECLDYKTENFLNDSDEVLLARMLFGEARNCGEIEKLAIAYTAINRANDGKAWNGKTIKEVILKPWQYSSFNKNDPNLKKLKNPLRYDKKSFYECLNISKNALSEKLKDPSNGATHFFNPRIVHPSWADSDKMTKIGKIENSKHVFYREN